MNFLVLVGVTTARSGLLEQVVQALLGAFQVIKRVGETLPALLGQDATGQPKARVAAHAIEEIALASSQQAPQALLLVQLLHAFDGVSGLMQQDANAPQHRDVVGTIESTPPARFIGRMKENLVSQNRSTCWGTFSSSAASEIVRKASGPLATSAPSSLREGAIHPRLHHLGGPKANDPARLDGGRFAGLGIAAIRARLARTWKTPNPDSFTCSPLSSA
jgi:hypothetical protein